MELDLLCPELSMQELALFSTIFLVNKHFSWQTYLLAIHFSRQWHGKYSEHIEQCMEWPDLLAEFWMSKDTEFSLFIHSAYLVHNMHF